MKRRLTILPVLLALLFGIVVTPAISGTVNAAPVQAHTANVHSQSHAAAFDKTKFVLHLGVAAFLIHYIYKKYKAGQLSRRHLFTVLKAAGAAAIAYHEMKTAYNLAQGSNSKTLHLLISPINSLTSGFSDLASRLKHGDTSTVSSLNSQENSFQSMAGKDGFAFKDQAPASGPGF